MIQPLPLNELEQVLDLAGPDLSTFREARIFLTGGTGFFGRWLIESWDFANTHLQLRGELHILSRNPEKFLSACPHLNGLEGVHFHPGDQASFNFPGGDFDFVVHGAVMHGSPHQTFLSNVEGVRHVLAFAQAARASRFLMISSGAVYGTQPLGLDRLPEAYLGGSDPLEASSAYGLMKSASEFLCGEATRSGRPACVIARPFAFV